MDCYNRMNKTLKHSIRSSLTNTWIFEVNSFVPYFIHTKVDVRKSIIKLIILAGVSWLNHSVSIPIEGRWWYGSGMRAVCMRTVKWTCSVR